MTRTVTFDELRAILIEAAGAVDDVDLNNDLFDADLYDIGYDSLALMEMAARIKERFAVVISDEEVTELRTFRLLLDRVNAAVDGPVQEGAR
jgi:acyl carrier protein